MRLILAADSHGGIALKGKLPWLADKILDFDHFKKMTQNGYLLAGRATAASLPPLEGRTVFSISKRTEGKHLSLEDALRHCSDMRREVWCIGGSKFAQSVLEKGLITEVFLTVFRKNYDCDLFLPEQLMPIIKSLNAISNQPQIFDSEWGIAVYQTFEHYTVYRCSPINQDARAFQKLMLNVYQNGLVKQNRTGVATKSLFGAQLSFNIEGWRFPLSTLRKSFFRGIAEELFWFCQGKTCSKDLEEKKINIWKGNSTREFLQKSNLPYEEGDCGPIYGFQWTHWGAEYQNCHTDYQNQGINQLEWIVNEIKQNPSSRRLVLSGWNVKDIPKMALPPCHVLYQFIVEEIDGNKYLSCHMYQRSSDIVLAGEWNIASASLLTFMIAKVTGCLPRKLTVSYGDVHIYAVHHVGHIARYLERLPYQYPTLIFPQKDKLTDYTIQDFQLINYYPHPAIDLEMVA